MVAALKLFLLNTILASTGWSLAFLPRTTLCRHPRATNSRIFRAEPVTQGEAPGIVEETTPIKSVEESISSETNAATKVEEAKGHSALILGWFFASDKQLELVKRIYKKNGFTDVVIKESKVPEVAKPLGWAGKVLRTDRDVKCNGAETSDMTRKFDVVHVMSGGFLQLYQLLYSGVKIDFNTLVLDSTPILPRPSSFVRFARAYLSTTKKLAWIPKLIPNKIHVSLVAMQWALGCVLVSLKIQVMRLLALFGICDKQWDMFKILNQQAIRGSLVRYQKTVDQSLETVFGARELRAIFVYNPSDPFINAPDVVATMSRVRSEFGCQVEEVQVAQDHIQTIFRKPKLIFTPLLGALS